MQWRALETLYEQKKARAIGVSNYCKECLQCLLKTANVMPMVNQVQYHVGMGADFGQGTSSTRTLCYLGRLGF